MSIHLHIKTLLQVIHLLRILGLTFSLSILEQLIIPLLWPKTSRQELASLSQFCSIHQTKIGRKTHNLRLTKNRKRDTTTFPTPSKPKCLRASLDTSMIQTSKTTRQLPLCLQTHTNLASNLYCIGMCLLESPWYTNL